MIHNGLYFFTSWLSPEKLMTVIFFRLNFEQVLLRGGQMIFVGTPEFDTSAPVEITLACISVRTSKTTFTWQLTGVLAEEFHPSRVGSTIPISIPWERCVRVRWCTAPEVPRSVRRLKLRNEKSGTCQVLSHSGTSGNATVGHADFVQLLESQSKLSANVYGPGCPLKGKEKMSTNSFILIHSIVIKTSRMEIAFVVLTWPRKFLKSTTLLCDLLCSAILRVDNPIWTCCHTHKQTQRNWS